ncbi:hypothetical protein SGRA_0372 [Saprospira grandis str. Lewin]|uniref:Uncharacterized protein n=1 Tax=Saprospira grandis (strain Lewin) TaxID=984262 RepID=H6L8X5_SAPGL|nr:hypothetical protein SGRA_0372 [Saprospira grandis str. Lewin]
MAAAFRLQITAKPPWPKAKRPSDVKGGGEAADQGRQAAGPSRPASPDNQPLQGRQFDDQRE